MSAPFTNAYIYFSFLFVADDKEFKQHDTNRIREPTARINRVLDSEANDPGGTEHRKELARPAARTS